MTGCLCMVLTCLNLLWFQYHATFLCIVCVLSICMQYVENDVVIFELKAGLQMRTSFHVYMRACLSVSIVLYCCSIFIFATSQFHIFLPLLVFSLNVANFLPFSLIRLFSCVCLCYNFYHFLLTLVVLSCNFLDCGCLLSHIFFYSFSHSPPVC